MAANAIEDAKKVFHQDVVDLEVDTDESLPGHTQKQRRQFRVPPRMPPTRREGRSEKRRRARRERDHQEITDQSKADSKSCLDHASPSQPHIGMPRPVVNQTVFRLTH
jgi:hypothetical protein